LSSKFAELKSEKNNFFSVSKHQKHSKRSDIIRTPEFINEIKENIDDNPRTSMRSLSKKFNVSEKTIRNVVHEDLRYKSYVMRKGQFLSDKTKETRLIRSKRLLNRLKNPAEEDAIWFFSDEKNFDQDQKFNRQNDRWLCKDRAEVPKVMHT
jgi:hypothetical protein